MKLQKLKTSNRALNVPASPMRKFFPLIQAAEKQGREVFKLNVGDPDLSPPKEFFETIKKYHSPHLNYAPSSGMTKHIQAWQKYYSGLGISLKADSIVPTLGCAEAILLALLAVADPGDEILVFEPLYVSYKSFAIMSGIKLVPITLTIENNFKLPNKNDIEKKITKLTKAIVIINPDNPTGKLWTHSELNLITGIAKKYNLFIIGDETYREIRFDGKKAMSLLQYKLAAQNIIVCDSASKRFSMPGARTGCVVSRNSEVMSGILKFAQARLSVGTLEQLALVPVLNNSQPYIKKILQEYATRRKIIIESLRKVPGVKFLPAMGAFYQTIKLPIKDSQEFAKFMIAEFSHNKQTVMITPMQDFYITKGLGKDEIRIAYVLKPRSLQRAMQLLSMGLKEFLK